MVKAKRGLGKGLGALIPDDNLDVSRETSGVENIDIDMIKPNKSQPRRHFDDEKLEKLAFSIEEHGVLQPILLQKLSKGFEIIAGERRWRAARKAGLNEIPAIVKDLENIDIAQIALIENLQREDLNAIEEANAFKSLMTEYNFTQDRVSKVVGKSRSHIANTVRLLSLGEEVKNFIINDQLTSGHGRALAVLESEELQLLLAKRIIDENLSVRDIERLISNQVYKKDNKKNINDEKDPSASYAESVLKDHFDTRVNVKMGKRKGKIEIEFYGEKDLSRILEIMKYK